MATLYIQVVNATFHSRDDGAEYPGPEAALAVGRESALAIAGDEIREGRPSSAVEICIEHADGTPVLRSVLAISISPLMSQLDDADDMVE